MLSDVKPRKNEIEVNTHYILLLQMLFIKNIQIYQEQREVEQQQQSHKTIIICLTTTQN